MRPYEAYPFSRPIDRIIINRPLLTNFGFLRARFFSLHALYTPIFNFNFAKLCFARFLCFLCLLFCLSRSFFASKFFARSRTFSFLLTFFSIAFRAFSFRAIACCNFLSAAVRCRWSFIFLSAVARSRARVTLTGLKNKASQGSNWAWHER